MFYPTTAPRPANSVLNSSNASPSAHTSADVGDGGGDVLLEVGFAEVETARGGSRQLFGSNRLNEALSSPAIGYVILQLNTSAIYEPKRTHPPADWYVRSVTERGQGKGPGSREA